MRVSLFVTCLADALLPQTAQSAVRVLQHYGVEVDFPAAQTCCGQPSFNSGYWDETREVARNWLRAFSDSEYIVAPSGSCTGMVAHYYPQLFKDDPALRAQAEQAVKRTYEWTQFLVDVVGVNEVPGRLDMTVTYHPTCHATRLLGLKDSPRKLLDRIDGLNVIDLPYADACCGFGGTFAVKMSAVSTAMVTEKVEHVADTGADFVVGTDLGCLINIGGRIRRQGRDIGVAHIAEVVDAAIRGVPLTGIDKARTEVAK